MSEVEQAPVSEEAETPEVEQAPVTEIGKRRALQLKVRQEAQALAAAVEAAETDEEKSDVFFKGVRESCIPYLPCQLRDDPEQCFNRSYEALFLLARANLPLAVGYAMHQYNLAAWATLPVPNAPEFERRRKIMVDSVERYKSLMAISSYGVNARALGSKNPNVVVDFRDGKYICNGKKNFQSMASKADILLFSGYLEDNTMGLFYCQLAGQDAIVPGPSLFGGAMHLTDTKPLYFKNLELGRRNVLSTEEWLTDHVSTYGTAWFEAMVSAAYLGGASRALEEVRKFARSVSVDQESMLYELDGFVLDAGRLAAKLRSSLALGYSFGPLVARYCEALINGAPEEEQDGLDTDLGDNSAAIKYATTHAAEEIVNGAISLVGSRSLALGHPLHALNEQIRFGPLHPTITAHYLRTEGEDLLEEEEYEGLYPWAYV